MDRVTDQHAGKGQSVGSRHYRAFVGRPDFYDLNAGLQFSLLCFLGLREHHKLLDFGCGSLKVGRLLIPYLQPGHYFGIEPEQWLIDEGIAREVGKEQIALKRPTFNNEKEFKLACFGQAFDFMVAHSIFSHASEAQIRTALGEAKTALGPEGFFAATFVEGDENYTGTEWVYPGIVSFVPEHILAMISESGLAGRAIDWPHPAGQRWYVIAHPDHLEKMPRIDAARNAVLEQELRLCRARLAEVDGKTSFRRWAKRLFS